jgi:sugar phosphate isomerase/epimerase
MRIGTMIEPKKIARAFLGADGAHTLAGEVKKLMAAGANHIEISGEAVVVLPAPLRDKFPEEVSGGLTELRESGGLTYSVHLPFFGGVNFTTSIESIRRASVDVVRDIVEQCAPLEPISYVLHVAGLLEDLMSVGLRNDAVVDAYLANAAQSVSEMLEFIPADRLCIENLEYIAFDKIFPLVERFDTKICMDIGHIKLRNEDVDEFIDKYGERIGHVHIHDVSYRLFDKRVRVMDDHRALGAGVMDIDAIIGKLAAIGFDRAVTLEVYEVDPTNSVKALKQAIEKAERGQSEGEDR